jgi:hypothetical protein
LVETVIVPEVEVVGFWDNPYRWFRRRWFWNEPELVERVIIPEVGVEVDVEEEEVEMPRAEDRVEEREVRERVWEGPVRYDNDDDPQLAELMGAVPEDDGPGVALERRRSDDDDAMEWPRYEDDGY